MQEVHVHSISFLWKIDSETGGLVIDPRTEEPRAMALLILTTMDHQTGLPMEIGIVEGKAIWAGKYGIEAPRPLTHDLAKPIIEGLGATLDSVLVTELRDGIFLGEVVLIDGKEERISVEARPSDAIALAVRTGAKILVADAVFEAAGVPIGGEAGEEPSQIEIEQQMSQFVRDLEDATPEDFNDNPESKSE